MEGIGALRKNEAKYSCRSFHQIKKINIKEIACRQSSFKTGRGGEVLVTVLQNIREAEMCPNALAKILHF